MPNKTRPAPLGATYKQDVRPRCSCPKPDAAPNGAKRVWSDRGYKDFTPTELRPGVAKDGHWITAPIPLVQANPNQIFVTFVSWW